MTTHDTPIGTARLAGRFLWHYAEMVVAMMLGMLLGLLWRVVLPPDPGIDVHALIMAADMTIGMAVWMRIRGHHLRGIVEMGIAMVAPFLVLVALYRAGAFPAASIMPVGHVLMFVAMAVAMLVRWRDYTRHPVPITATWAWRAAVLLIALAVPAAVSGINAPGKFRDQYTIRADAVTAAPAPRAHDPAKPTVAFLTGAEGTNAADLFGPYETLATTGRFNLYIVSAGARVVPMTGGLDVVPDLTFAELTRLLDQHGDRLEAGVIPALQPPGPAESAAISAWLRQQSAGGTLLVSVCHGARILAASGLLDGRPATSHWTRMAALRTDFPAVAWTTGKRYVEDGNLISTAGVVSGIEGGLRIIERLFDADAARAAAAAMHWRHHTPGAPGDIPQSGWELPDLVAVLNASYQPGPTTIGVRLFDGVSELELASAFMSYTEQSVIGRTVAVGDGPIRSEHGVTFVPRSTVAAAHLDRLVVPGHDAAARELAGTGPSPATGGLQPVYLHGSDEFAFDPVLRDIAATYDVATARFAAKTLEYPVLDVALRGDRWPWSATLVPLLLALLGAAAALVTGRVWRDSAARRTPAATEAAPAELVR